jgi:hypothetical protein
MPPEYVRGQYMRTLADPDYRQLIRKSSRTKVIGMWDDHDYGSNNADHTLHTKYV